MKPWERYAPQSTAQQPAQPTAQPGPWARYGGAPAAEPLRLDINGVADTPPESGLLERAMAGGGDPVSTQTLSDLVTGNKPAPAGPNPWGLLEALGAGPLKGMLNLPQSVGYLLPKSLEFSTSLGGFAPNPVSEMFGTSARTVSDFNRGVNESFKREHGDSLTAKAGEIGGSIVGASALPFVKGAEGATALWKAGGVLNRLKSVLQAAGLGAGQGVALGTQTEDDSVLKNAAIGGAAGGVGQIIGGKLMDRVARKAAAAASPANVLRDRAATAAHEAGYVIPPSQTNPSLTNRVLEGTAGKISTAQRASRANERVTNDLVARALKTSPENLTPEGLEAIRTQANQAYEALKAGLGPVKWDQQFLDDLARVAAPSQRLNQSFPGMGGNQADDLVASLTGTGGPIDAETLVEALKQLRADSRSLLKNTADPAAQRLGKAQKGAAKAIESFIDRTLAQSGRTDLLDAFRSARELIAKTHTVEKALGSTGTVSAPKLASALERGAPLTGELRTVAEVARAFPKATQNLGNQSVLPISPLDWVFGTGMTGAGYMAGNPYLGAVAAARPIIRGTILSAPYQRMMGAPPDYATSAMLRALAGERGPLLPLTAAPALIGAGQ